MYAPVGETAAELMKVGVSSWEISDKTCTVHQNT